MPTYLNALKIQFYRGIGAEPQTMAPFKDFNFFIGANNAGKSTILNFISAYLPFSSKGRIVVESIVDEYRGKVTGKIAVWIGISKIDFLANCLAPIANHANIGNIRVHLLKIFELFSEDGWIWLRYKNDGTGAFSLSQDPDLAILRTQIGDNAWQSLWSAFTGQQGGSVNQHWVPETLQQITKLQPIVVPTVKLIPALRQIGKRGAKFEDFTGEGLIDRLAEIQSPDHDKRHEEKLFNRINSFLQMVTGKAESRIEIPHNREHILVHMDNKVLPLSSLGMGIHEVILIASFCTITENSIVCIEEPEIHLHPLLQKKLIQYLKLQTSNQYFIATHSASFIDTPEAAIFHVFNDGDQTRIRESILRSERYKICQDLGYRASDIVQSKSVIWVEGPSDRIYIRHWISSLAPELSEGIHYSIMFYGGRLLSHLSADSKEIDDFIDLRSLNRNIAVVIDSDKSYSGKSVNATKLRIQDEMGVDSSICWITKGREIENYIDHSVLQASVRSCYPDTYEKPGDAGKYSHALHFIRKFGGRRRRDVGSSTAQDLVQTSVDKVAVARLVCSNSANLDILDLRERIQEVVNMVREANR